MNTIVKTPKTFIRIVVATAVACTALCAGVRADQVPQAHVSYADLNLNTHAGATVLFRRILGAADQVCALPLERDLAHVAETKACKARVMAQAVGALDNPNLTEVYEQRVGNTASIQLAAR